MPRKGSASIRRGSWVAFPILLGVWFLVLAQVTAVQAQSPHTAHTLELDDPTRRPAASIGDVAWLSGSWVGEAFGGVAEEIWSAPSGGTMVGMFKLMHGGRPSMYEFELIVEEAGSLTFKLKHFNADLHGWEAKDAYVSFPLVRIVADTANFAGLTFIRQAPEHIVVYLAIEQGGETQEAVIRYRRVSPLEE